MNKVDVGILLEGATGMVGQHFIRFLEGHPWFNLTWLGASERSAGKMYYDAAKWNLTGAAPARVAGMTVDSARPDPNKRIPRFLFSAMDAAIATEIEQSFARAGHIVVSNSKNHRMDPDVPLLVPEINAEHLRIIPKQRRDRGWSGAIITNPNCATVSIVMALAPLKPFGIERVIATTMQAVSGAGYPGVPSMDILGNVIPFIGGEEEKMEQETQKILGTADADHIEPMAARGERALQPGCGGGWTYGRGLRRAGEEARRRRDHRRDECVLRHPTAQTVAERAMETGAVYGRSGPSAAAARR